MTIPRVRTVKPDEDYRLTLTFTNGEVRHFDMKPYLDTGIFRELKDPRAFNSVRPFLGSIQWSGGQGLCPDTLYLESVPVSTRGRKRRVRSRVGARVLPEASQNEAKDFVSR